MIKFLFSFFFVICGLTLTFSQSCDLDFEDFTGSTNTDPPSGWIRGDGTNIGASFPANPILDPAVGFNNSGEYMISDAYSCIGEVCFLWHTSGSTSNHDVEIAISQDTSNWIPIDTIFTAGMDTLQSYRELCVPVPAGILVPPFQGRVRWKMIRRTSGSFYLENVCIDSSFCVVEPTELQFEPIAEQCRETNVPFTVTVCATDSNGFTSDTFSGDIVLNKLVGPGTLNGALTYTAINGCATITDISFDAAGDYVLSGSSGSFSGTSDTIPMVDDCPSEVQISVMSYNLLNYPNGRDDCGPNTVVLSRWDTLEKIVHYYLPDVLMVCELQNEFGSDKIIDESLNSHGYSNYAAAEFIENQSTASVTFNNMLYYNQTKLTLYSQSELLTSTRDFNKYVLFVNDPNLSLTQDTVFIDFYMAHLKAGSASADSIRRANDCLILRAHLDSMPDRNSVLGGDLNFYTANEAAYQTLTSGINPLNDPADMEGDWDGNFTYRKVHTQSSRGPGDPTYDCGFNGGSDSRFDFLLVSDAIENNSLHVNYVDSSYATLGNDGSIFNKAINDPANTSGVPDSVLDAMYYMSDHLPVVMEMNVTLPEPACPTMLTISDNPIASGTYTASMTITSSGVIQAPAIVTYKAANCIELTSPFEVNIGATFEATIGGCD